MPMKLPLLGRRTLTVERYAPGSYISEGPSAGQWQQGARTTTSISGSLQPVGNKEAQLLPEGIRQSAMFKLYTDPSPELVTWDIEAGTEGDIIIVDGERLRVYGLLGYDGAMLNHRRYMLIRMTDAR